MSDNLLKNINFRVGNGYDVHRLVSGRPLILGGVKIPWDKGLEGHSDADVLTHALMDALLGGASLPDIGRLFPDNDDSYKNISSLILLGKVMTKLRDAGWDIVNVDCTIICQEPKLAPHIDKMKATLAETMKVEESRIGLKATTTEGLGFTGRGEGIACQAVCLLASVKNREHLTEPEKTTDI